MRHHNIKLDRRDKFAMNADANNCQHYSRDDRSFQQWPDEWGAMKMWADCSSRYVSSKLSWPIMGNEPLKLLALALDITYTPLVVLYWICLSSTPWKCCNIQNEVRTTKVHVLLPILHVQIVASDASLPQNQLTNMPLHSHMVVTRQKFILLTCWPWAVLLRRFARQFVAHYPP